MTEGAGVLDAKFAGHAGTLANRAPIVNRQRKSYASAGPRPEAVEDGVASTQPGGIALDWEDAPRAARYKVLKQVVGVDAQPVFP